jgi:hypothetical protein
MGIEKKNGSMQYKRKKHQPKLQTTLSFITLHMVYLAIPMFPLCGTIIL